MKQTDLVKTGYDIMARDYLDNRPRLKSTKYVQKLLKYLPKNSRVLDLGCGAGVGVDDLIIKAGHSVIGIDISKRQIELARKHSPKGEYSVGDICDLRPGDYQVQAVVAFYALFHVPRSEHAQILCTISQNLVKDGLLLVTMGDREFEGEHKLYGVPMWSSQWGTAKNRQLVESAGFKIVIDEIDTSGGERHQVILAEKT